MDNKNRLFDLSLNDTTCLKGVALLLLLFHHLFYEDNGNFNDITICGYNIIQQTSLVAKVCVAIFVLLSGYGLTVQSQMKPIETGMFYKRRLAKLYPNYWLIWFLFVPIGFIFFDMTSVNVYGAEFFGGGGILKMLANMLGVQCLFGYYGINPTWWFYSCIIILYAIFPMLNKACDKWLIVIWAVSYIFLLLKAHLFEYTSIRFYLPIFILGMIMARFRNCNSRCLSRIGKPYIIILLIVLLVAFIAWRMFGPIYNGAYVDMFISFLIVVLFRAIDVQTKIILGALGFLGRHSMNIFLFHTFIYLIYFAKFIYSSRNPLIIYLLLLSICIFISMIIERIKMLPFLRKVFDISKP